jgi:hypothetical protein
MKDERRTMHEARSIVYREGALIYRNNLGIRTSIAFSRLPPKAIFLENKETQR